MFCTKCGIAVQDRDAYCSQCGTATMRGTHLPGLNKGQRLTRSRYDKKVAGLCGGLAEYLAVDPTLIRLIWLILLVSFPPVLLGYIAGWIIVPNEPARLMPPLAAEPSQQTL